MKVCPQCSFSNDERFPTCAYCNANIADVPAVDSVPPSAGEAERRSVAKVRRQLHGKQMRSASIFYTGAITLTALCPGLVFRPEVLLLYFLCGIFVAGLIVRNAIGRLSGLIFQGVLSLALLMAFGTAAGSFHPLLPFMLLSHIILPMLFWHWTAMIDDAHR